LAVLVLLLSGCRKATVEDSEASLPDEPYTNEALSWSQLERVHTRIRSGDLSHNTVKTILEREEEAPVRYLQGMIALEKMDFSGALDCFASIPPETIPAAFLYLPYRLHGQVRSGDNPYWNPLLASVQRKELEGLVAARVHLIAGQPLQGLQQYLNSDPANWKRFDLQLLEQLQEHAGLGMEMRRLVGAAFRAGRLSPDLGKRALRTAYGINKRTEPAALLAGIDQELRTNPDFRKTALIATERLLDIQALFLERRYADILQRYGGLEASLQADRTVLILFLSSVMAEDAAGGGIWSQELYRRYPTSEMKKWIHAING